VVLIALFVISVKLVMPTVGQELMPPMDTGAIAIKITTVPTYQVLLLKIALPPKFI